MAPLLSRIASRLTSSARHSHKMAANYNHHLLTPQQHLTELIRPGYGVLRSSVNNFSTSTDPISIDICMPFKGHKLEPPSLTVETSAKELMEFYTLMTRMRRLEIVSDLLYKAKLIRGFCHLYDGQEAICVGMEAALTMQDNIITGYRDHCFQLTRGSTMQSIFAELMGRKDGCTLGKGGSMHFYNKPNGFFGGHGIVGAQMPLGAGLAFAQKYAKLKNVSCTLYGDGASNQGQLFETLNIAALWNLPVIFICENNHYGMGTAEWRASKSPDFYKRGDYVPGLRVDGMNPLAVKQAIAFAKQYVLEKGPLMIEMDTYRYHGHSMSDPGSTYRTRDEIADVRAKRDPIEKVKKYILEHNIATEEELKTIDKDIKREVDEALAAAKASPEPDASMLWKHTYVKGKDIQLYGCDRKHSVSPAE